MSDEQTVKVGDWLMRMTPGGRKIGKKHGRLVGLEVGQVSPVGTTCGASPEWVDGDGWCAAFNETDFANGDWHRVPPGYKVPPVADLLAATVRLVEAYRAMLRDPETGAAGVDATVRQMAALAGIEVAA